MFADRNGMKLENWTSRKRENSQTCEMKHHAPEQQMGQ